MFFDQELVNSDSFRNAWLAGHGQSIDDQEMLEYENVASQILGKLNETKAKRRSRLSLRTSAVLVSGVARLFAGETDKLLHDCSILNETMKTRNRKLSSSTSNRNGTSREEYLCNTNSSNSKENTSNNNCADTKNISTAEVAVQTERSYLSKTAVSNSMCYIQVHDCNGVLKRIIYCPANSDILTRDIN